MGKLFIFALGAVVGGLVMTAIASTHPEQSKEALRNGADHITAGVAAGATAASNAASKQFGK